MGVRALLRTNLATNPQPTEFHSTPGLVGWRNARWFGGGSGAGTYTILTNQLDGPIPGITRYTRKQWTVAGNTPGDTGFEHTLGGTGGLPVSPGDVITVASYLRVNGTDKVGGIQVNLYDSAGALVTAAYSGGGTQTTSYPAGQWVRIVYTLTAPANSAFLHAISDIDGGTNWQAGESLDGTGLLIGINLPTTDYFDGSSWETRDRFYKWNGMVHGSTSSEYWLEDSGLATLGPGNSLVNLKRKLIETVLGPSPVLVTEDSFADIKKEALEKVLSDNGLI